VEFKCDTPKVDDVEKEGQQLYEESAGVTMVEFPEDTVGVFNERSLLSYRYVKIFLDSEPLPGHAECLLIRETKN
jgi:hypothetical protein